MRGAESFSYEGARKLVFDSEHFNHSAPALLEESYQPLGANVVRFETTFLSKNGSITQTPPAPGELQGLFVAFALMPEYVRQQFPEWRSVVSQSLRDPVNDELPSQVWDITTLPAPLARSVRIYQRYFSLNQPDS